MERAGVLIVGGGQAGSQCAFSLRDMGFTDSILIVGGEPSLPYQRPPLSKAFLTSDAPIDSLLLRGEPAWARSEVSLHLGDPVTAVDPKSKVVQLRSGLELRYDTLVLAQGGQARGLTVPAIDTDTGMVRDEGFPEGLHTLRSAADAEQLREALSRAHHVLLIGSGFIGLEVAASARTLGLETTVVGRADRVMAKIAHSLVSDVFRTAFESRGVTLELNSDVEALLENEGKVTGVRLASGRELSADLVVVGLGLIPETTLATHMGLEVDGGIVVDECGRTSVPDVFAIGDCANRRLPSGEVERIESVHNAIQGAKRVAAIITGHPLPPPEAPWVWSDQFTLKLQIAGQTPVDSDTTVIGDVSEEKFVVEHRQDGRLIGVTAVSRPGDFLRYRRELDRLAQEEAASITTPDTSE